MKPISYSAMSKYHTCPALYKFHYLKRLRPKGTSSALVFGSAIDDALNAALLKTGDAIDTFRKAFTWEVCKDLVWLQNDLDADLFTAEELEQLKGKSTEYYTWACMRKKGRIMLNGYMEKVYPLIEEVHGVQIETKTRPGFVDAVLSLKGHGRVLIDHKTTSKFYKRSSVKESPQLALYASELGISKIGYITLSKQIPKSKQCTKCGKDGTGTRYKTCHNVRSGERCHGNWNTDYSELGEVQILIDTVEKTEQDLALASINETEQAIKAGLFPHNLSACSNMYGKPCQYYNFCRAGDLTGLETKEER